MVKVQRSAFSLLIVLGLASVLNWAQTSTTSLRGTVSDPKGAVVPGAEVTILNSATGFSRSAKTDDQGFYQFLEIPPATYSLTIKAAGFGVLHAENVRLLVNTPTNLNETLRVQAVAETVDVMSQAPLVNTEDASMGHAFTADQMTTLPFEGRDPVSILSLQPGVLYTGSSTNINPDADSRSGAVSGARSDQTNITVDGLDDNDPVFGYSFQGALRSTLDSLEEFRVTTTNSNADSGRSSGAQVSLVTKSGTNKFHGSLYEYNRSKIGEANEWFNERSELLGGQPNVPPHLVRNTFGGSIGGPIIKNRFFFFATYEGQRTHETAVVTRFVPTASLRSGLLTYQCDNGGNNATCPSNGLFTLNKTDLANLDPYCSQLGNCPQGPGVDPAALTAFNAYPLPNNPTVGDGLNVSGYTFADPTPGKLDTYIVKLDYNLTQNGSQHLFLRGNLQNDHLTTQGAQFPGQPPGEIETNNGKGLAAGYTSVISNSLINNFRYGYIREGIGKAGLQTSGYIGFYAGGISNPVSETPTTNVQVPLNNFVDDLTWTRGKHSLQFGTNLRIINNLRQSNAQSFINGASNPTWLAAGGISGQGTSLDPNAFPTLGFPEVSPSFRASYDLGATAITGMVPEVTADYQMTKNFNLLPEGSMVPRHFRAHEAEWYAQDAWRVKSNLTLTFGLRYSLLQPPYETTGTQVAPNPGISQWFRNRYIGQAEGLSIQPPFTFALSGQANGKPPIWNWDYKNLAPRFAFAWSPDFSRGSWLGRIFGESGKSSLRGGYGMYYDHFGEGVINSFDRMGSFGLTTVIGDPAGLVTPDQSPRFTSLNSVPSTYFACANGGNPPCTIQKFQLQTPPPTGGFPYAPPSTPETGGESISWGLDNGLRTPYSHVVDFSFTRDLGRGFVLETSYVGRFGHRLLQQLDVAQPLNLRDPKSGMDLYTATKMIAAASQAGVPVQNLNKIPFFENIFPLNAHQNVPVNPNCVPAGSVAPANPTATQNMYEIFGCDGGLNMTTYLIQADWYCDPTGASFPACATVNGATKPFQFWTPQFSSLYVWSTMGNSSYNALQASLRRKMSGGLQFDFNYTYSKSIDLGSDAERVNQYEGGTGVAGGGFASYIMNTWNPNQNRAVSDFDATHQFNANWMYQLPVGKDKHYATHGVLNAIIGNWELTGIFRMTSGFPTTVNDGNYWPTNWENTANAVLVGKKPQGGTYMVNGGPNIFKDPCCDPNSAINQFRFALPGEGGERNSVRGDGYFGIDMGLGKTWNVTESSVLRFSWETFNITNSVRFDAAALEPIAGSNASGNLSLSNSSSFGYYTSTLSAPRVMQFALRFSF